MSKQAAVIERGKGKEASELYKISQQEFLIKFLLIFLSASNRCNEDFLRKESQIYMIVNCSWNRTSHESFRVHGPKMNLTHAKRGFVMKYSFVFLFALFIYYQVLFMEEYKKDLTNQEVKKRIFILCALISRPQPDLYKTENNGLDQSLWKVLI